MIVRNEIQQLVQYLDLKKNKRRKLIVTISLVAFIIILSTFYLLILPASTLEKEPTCGIEEHNHVDACYSQETEFTEENDSSTSGEDADASAKPVDGIDTEKPAEPGANNEATVPATPGENTGTTIPVTPAVDAVTTTPVTAENNTATTSLTTPAENAATTVENSVTAVPAEKPNPSTRTEYIYQENGLKVTAVLSDPAAIPDEAKLAATRITANNDAEEYTQYQQLLQNSLGTADTTVFSAYDICFLLNGQEIEPKEGSSVNVTIEDTSTAMAFTENLQVFHVIEEASKSPQLQAVVAKTTDLNGESAITFTADSFSTYVVVAPTIPTNSSLAYKLIDDDTDTFTQTEYYNPNQLLGIAGNFHLVAFDTATLGSHTNGNILTNKLNANVNFGTNNLSSELSYVQNYTIVKSVSAASDNHVLVLGTKNAVTLVDNNNSFAINGTKLDKPKNIWQDADTSTLPFIDLVQVKNQISEIASTIAQMSSVNISSNLNNGGSCDASYLTLTNPDKVGVYNISANDLNNYGYFGIKGFQTDHEGTVIINVDCSSASTTLSLPVCEMYVGTTKLGFNEVTNFINGRVIWNFGNYSGVITTNRMYGTVIAPNATINVNQNLNGTIIGNNVTINAESHRDDFVGKLSNGETVTVNKIWLGNDGTPLNNSEVTGMTVIFQLYQSSEDNETKTAVGDPVTLDGSKGWTAVWNELPNGYTYSVAEIGVTKDGTDVTEKYKTSYSTESCENSGTFDVSNQLIYTLPNTGGSGTLLLTIVGLTLMGTALYKYRKIRTSGTRQR